MTSYVFWRCAYLTLEVGDAVLVTTPHLPSFKVQCMEATIKFQAGIPSVFFFLPVNLIKNFKILEAVLRVSP